MVKHFDDLLHAYMCSRNDQYLQCSIVYFSFLHRHEAKSGFLLDVQVVIMPAAKQKSFRAAAVIAYIMCMHIMDSDGHEQFWKAYEKKFEELAQNHGVAKSYMRKFAVKWYNRFRDSYNLDERARRKPSLSDEVARRLAEKLLDGVCMEIEVEQPQRGKKKKASVRLSRQRWYRSIAEFISMNADVRAAMEDCKNTTVEALKKTCGECALR